MHLIVFMHPSYFAMFEISNGRKNAYISKYVLQMSMITVKQALQAELNSNVSFKAKVLEVGNLKEYHAQNGDIKKSFNIIVADHTACAKIRVYGEEALEKLQKSVFVMKALNKGNSFAGTRQSSFFVTGKNLPWVGLFCLNLTSTS